METPKLSPSQLTGPEWLQAKRAGSLTSYNDLPLPQRGLHLWRYTDPRTFVIDSAEATTTSVESTFADVARVEKQHFDDGHLDALVIDNQGQTITSDLSADASAAGLVAGSLTAALDSHRELAERYLYALVNTAFGKFEAMNGALWQDGVFVYVPDNAVLTRPIHLLREAGTNGSRQFPRLLVIVGANAEATVIDEYGGGADEAGDTPSYSNGVVEVFGGAGSRTRYISLQRHGRGMNAYLTHRAQIANDASMVTVPLAFGGATTKQNFGVNLNGRGANSEMAGLLFGGNYQHFDNHTLHHHTVGDTYSNIDYRVALKDRALSAYTGLIRIDQKAKNCEAYQENRNLLLNPGTRAETIPELEILNEDVSCSHGATVGPIDPLMLFYLTCRGIPTDVATRMIVSGFVASTFDKIPSDARERVAAIVESRLGDI